LLRASGLHHHHNKWKSRQVALGIIGANQTNLGEDGRGYPLRAMSTRALKIPRRPMASMSVRAIKYR